MTPEPWLGDACSLVDALRAKELSPLEALDATLAAIEGSELNAFSHVDADAARATAAGADVDLPFGGVPVGVKELDRVAGWPHTEASLVFADRRATSDSTQVARLRAAGSVLVGLTTASEFGGINVTSTRLNGSTHNPWRQGATPGGSSGGSAAAVARGLVALGSAGDGGGSIRIPAAFCGLPGLKTTYGRIPKGPDAEVGNITAVVGCISRSIRDIARWLDIANGPDGHDPLALPRVHGFEAGLGQAQVAGLRVAVVPNLGVATIHPDVEAAVRDGAEALITEAGLKRAEVDIAVPELDLAWALTGLAGIRAELGDLYPGCEGELTDEIAFGLKIAGRLFDFEAAARIESARRRLNGVMANAFDQVDIIIAATNPDTAFGAEGPMPSHVAGTPVPLGNNGALTIPANIFGNPAISLPVGLAAGTGLPVGMQVMARHHAEPLLLGLGRIFEAARPWPLVAP